jgi:hypothetical protein
MATPLMHIALALQQGVSFMGADDEYVVSGSDDGHVYVWSKATGALLWWAQGDDDGERSTQVTQRSWLHSTFPMAPLGNVQQPCSSRLRPTMCHARQGSASACLRFAAARLHLAQSSIASSLTRSCP